MGEHRALARGRACEAAARSALEARAEIEVLKDARHDVVVVGSGAAGGALAARLAERGGGSVLVVEAGPVERQPEADRLSNVSFALTQRDWGLEVELAPGRRSAYPQGKAAGGSSAVNGALALRGLPSDYDGWAALGNAPWSWAELLPCFRRLEDDRDASGPLHGRGGPIPIVRWGEPELTAQQRAFRDGCLAHGFAAVADHNDGRSFGVGPFPMNRAEGRRVSTAMGYLEPARALPGLAIEGGARAVRVRFEGRRATGVELEQRGERRFAAAREVILAAGAIQTPALLWRSGVGPAAELARLGIDVVCDLPGVGASLMEHVGAFLLAVPEPGVCDPSEVQFQLGVRAPRSEHADEGELFFGMMSYWDLAAQPELAARAGAPLVFALTCGVQRPHARGRVRLDGADPSLPPRVELNLLGHPEDRRRLRHALRTCRALAAQPPLARRIRRLALLDDAAFHDDAALDAYLAATCLPWYHPSGTARMGPDRDPGAVVDPTLRVRGVEGLRVADASVIPRIPRAPTNLTCIAIGERAADLVAAGS